MKIIFSMFSVVLTAGLMITATAQTTAMANYGKGLQGQLDQEQNEAERKTAIQERAEYERKLRLAKRRLVRWQKRLKRYQRELYELEQEQEALKEEGARDLEERFRPGGRSKQTELRLSRRKIQRRLDFRRTRREMVAQKAKILWAKGWIKNTEVYVKLYTDLEAIAEKRFKRSVR